jgi:superoxide dismutase, Cu-Zn family
MRTLVSCAAALMLAGCATTMTPNEPKAVADVQPTAGNTATGTVNLVQRGANVTLVARLTGVPPGKHGFHIHEKGDCSAPDAMSAGGHFNPSNAHHGNPQDIDHHAGDLPVIDADAGVIATLDAVVMGAALGGGGTFDVVGKSVVVHKDPDDFKTQPAGNSGPRIACGVIKAA